MSPLVKTKNCKSNTDNSCYEPLIGGNGLIIVLQPDTDDNKVANENLYKNPNKWMCSYGLGGSYASYQPYKYNKDNLTGEGIIGTLFGENPRKVYTTFNLEWRCDDNVNLWFTGYDYKNIKMKDSNGNYITDTSIYPSPHIYNLSDLNYFMPDYDPEITINEDYTITETTINDCADDGVPTSITLNDGTIIKKTDNLISCKNVGGIYRYEYYPSDSSIKNYVNDNDEGIIQTYPTDIPTRIYVKIKNNDKDVDEDKRYDRRLITKTDNGLIRKKCTDTSSNYCYNFFIKIYDLSTKYDLSECKCKKNDGTDATNISECSYRRCEYNISVHSDDIVGSYCEGDNSDPTIDITKSSIIKKVSYADCGENCIANDNKTEIYTPYGPFSGFQNDTINGILPMIYEPYHMCRGTEKQFIFDEQEGNKIAFSMDAVTKAAIEAAMDGKDLTGMKRNNMEKFWRVEFTNPILENDSNYKGITNEILDVSCPTNDIPDLMFIDLTKTNEWLSTDGAYPQTVLIYKDQNNLSKESSNYYLITYDPWGWVDEKISQYDTRIVNGGITCGGVANCSPTEIPEIEIVNNNEIVKLINKDGVNGNSTIKPYTENVYSFMYNGNTYSINANSVTESTGICNIKSGLKSWLSYLFTASYSYDEARSKYYANLGRAPFIISCGKTHSGSSDVSYAYKYPYSKLSNISTKDYTLNPNANEEIFAGNDEGEKVFVLTTNNKQILSSPYYAHCTNNWNTDGWMLLDNSNDMSSFNITDNGITGTYISKPNQNLTWNDISKKYTIEKLWAKHGGMITNTIYKQSGCTKRQLLDNNGNSCSNCGEIYTDCTISDVEHRNPKFTTIFDKQIILLKSLGSDPLNTSDTDCNISVSGTTHKGSYTLKSNEPFGNVLSSNQISSMNFSKDNVENESSNTSTSVYQTINGDTTDRNNFFKRSEFYRNLIGAGIVSSSWHVLTDENGSAIVFDKGETINITPSSNSFYAMGNLSHKGSASCISEIKQIGYATAISAEYATALASIAAIKLGKLVGKVLGTTALISDLVAMDETFSKAEPIPNTTLNSSNIDAFNDKAVPKVPIRKNIIPTFNILFKPYF